MQHALAVSTSLTPLLHRDCKRQCSGDCLVSHAQASCCAYLGPPVLQHPIAQPIEPVLQLHWATSCCALPSVRHVCHLPSGEIHHTQIEAVVFLQPSVMLCLL